MLTVFLSILVDSYRLWSGREPYSHAYHGNGHDQDYVLGWLHDPKASRGSDAGSANGEPLRSIRQGALLDKLPNGFSELRVRVDFSLELRCRTGEAERRQNPEGDGGQ